MSFLADAPGPRPWQLPEGGRGRFEPTDLFLGTGPNALEVAVAKAPHRPNATDVRNLWKRRKGGRAAPLLLVVLYPEGATSRAAVCGPAGEDPAVHLDRDPGQIERIARAALAEPNRNAAIRFLSEVLPETESELPGVRNVGMFATHELEVGVPRRPDWAEMSARGRRMLAARGRALVDALGFTVETLGTATSVLRVADSGARAAVAVFLDEGESPDAASVRFDGSSPVSYALAKADAEALPYVVVTRGSQIRVYSARNTGIGRKGRAETYVEINVALLPDDLAGYLPLLAGAEALRNGGTFEEILERSRDFAAGLGERLRERIYDDVVPRLAMVIARHADGDFSEGRLAELYEQAMVVLFRLLFVAYAEDRDLLPYRQNGLYQRHALKTLARDLADRANADRLEFDDSSTQLWEQVRSLWRAVDQGNRTWSVPAYDGGMFSDGPEVNPAGAAIAGLELTDEEIGPALFSLLVDVSDEDVYGPVDFRSLSVREFGTIYEGLLESSLGLSAVDLTRDADGTYLPAGDGDTVAVEAGEVYLHDRSGARKSTGSYFTKPFAVEHLLDHALEPALDAHVERLRALIEAGEEDTAAEAFFDFRVADIAMGSGHFLVAAVDHIERRLTGLFAEHRIPGVVNELARLRATALENLGELADGVQIEDSNLLRRQIARRCIYGVDVNRIAVELARLGMWVHTFVPGLPLSFLDHNLVHGDSLTGIGTLDEAVETLVPDTGKGGTPSLLRDQIREWLGRAEDALRRLARVSDASAAEIREARAAHADALAAVEPARQLFDLLVGVRLGEMPRFEFLSDETVSENPALARAEELANELRALHFPIAFPEVFLRDRPGFDCILGNPPWEEATVEELGFWALRFPGLKSLTQSQQRREVARLRQERPDLVAEYEREVEEMARLRALLAAGPFPGMGTGDPDLYKAFAWRFWQLVADGGSVGVVLPRSALSAAGSAIWRETILNGGTFADVTALKNTDHWVFDDVTAQYTIVLVCVRKGSGQGDTVRLRGPYRSLAAFRSGTARPPVEFPADEFRTWATGAAFPLLPLERSGEVFLKLRAHPRLDSDEQPWRVRPVTELHATNEKKQMILDPVDTTGLWPVYKGASFNLWEPDTGVYYAWADPDHITEYLYQKRLRQARRANSAFSEMPPEWIRDRSTLPCLHPRIAFRDVARGTDPRTVITALVPPLVVVANQAPYLLWLEGDARDEAFLLGVLASIPLDWYARRMVETHVNFHILNAFPIPNPERDDPIRRRVEQIAGRLAAVDHRYKAWADAVGVPVTSVTDPDEKEDLIAELDAAVALLYGLDESDVVHIFKTFHDGWDHQPRLDRVLRKLRTVVTTS